MAIIDDSDGGTHLIGTPEDDRITGGQSTRLEGRGGDDEIYGGNYATLIGGQGDDTLVSGYGPDTLYGGPGDDTLIVDFAYSDTRMFGGAGFDTVVVTQVADLSESLKGVERLQLVERDSTLYLDDDIFSPTGAMNLFIQFPESSEESVQQIILFNRRSFLDCSEFTVENVGPEDVLVVYGGDLNDRIIGGRHNEMFSGGAGDDTLRGGGGDDVLYGGFGNDTYFVESAQDIVTAGVEDGFDRVIAATSYRLLAGAEIEVLRTLRPGETTALDLVGNEFSNLIAGNDGANVLRGGRGEDTLLGHDGGDRLVGSDGNDVLAGQAGDDVLDSGRGADRLIGGEGADRFLFRAVGASAADVRGQDTIVDFERADGDVIDLSMIDADLATARDDAFRLVDGPFTGAAGELRVVASAKGALLLGDVDGDGTAEFGLLVSGQTAMTEADFAL